MTKTSTKPLKPSAMRLAVLACVATAFMSGAAAAQEVTKLTLAMSGWTGFAPLTLAEKAGLFEKNGVTVEIKFIPQKDRLAALASGSVQAVATTVDTQILWATTVPLTQVLVLDNSNGGDGLVARPGVGKVADLKGKSIAVDGPGTTPYFMLAYILKRNEMTLKDVKLSTLGPSAAAQAFVAGQFDAAVSYEPYLSQVRAMPQAGNTGGKILATTVDYPVVVDTVAFEPAFIAKNPKAVAGVVKGFFAALEMIKTDPAKSNEIMGAAVKQTGDQFKASAAFIKWLDQPANKDYMAKTLPTFMQFAADVQMGAGVIKQMPNFAQLADSSFVQ
jgi:NitT/TauT family transport system substrate-binding protein